MRIHPFSFFSEAELILIKAHRFTQVIQKHLIHTENILIKIHLKNCKLTSVFYTNVIRLRHHHDSIYVFVTNFTNHKERWTKTDRTRLRLSQIFLVYSRHVWAWITTINLFWKEYLHVLMEFCCILGFFAFQEVNRNF